MARFSFLADSIRPFVLLLAFPVAALNGGLASAWEQLTSGPARTPPRQSGDQATEQRAATSPAGRISRATPHLAFVATLSRPAIVPGTRMSVEVNVTPKKGMHVYAPGSTYRPVAIKIQPDPLIRLHDPVYSKPILYLFKPLNEQVLVYSAPFRIVLDITPGGNAAAQAQLRSRSSLTLKGTLEYQACDDNVCYLPVSVPLQWNVPVKR